MKKILGYIGILILILGSLITVLIFNSNKLDDVKSSVVYIESIDEKTIRSGSGFVYKNYNNKNYILTNYHVIEGYTDIYIYNNNEKKEKATILKYDEYTDIAILTIEDSLNLKEINIGDSDKIKNNNKIYVVGTPLDIENINTINDGVITSKSKKLAITTTHGTSNLNAIEVDAKVDYGNSGGPLLNKNNEVIGMMFVKEDSSDGLSYALPINFVMEIAHKLENNELNRPNLGAVMCNTTNTELLNQYGIRINDIAGVVILEIGNLGTLDKSGLQKGDIITKFDNESISNVSQLRNELYKRELGTIVHIEYYRNENFYNIDIKLQ